MGSWKASLIFAMSFFLVLDALVIAARVFVRVKLIRSFGWDDGVLCLSLLGYVMACLMSFISMYYGFAADAGEEETYFDTVKMDKFYWACQLCLYISSGIVKVAVALVLYRLATASWNRAVLAISIVVVILWTAITTIFSAFICAENPAGVSNFVGSQLCTDVGYFRMISNIIIDYFFALYPIGMVWKANLARKMKVIVCCLLGLGILASAATIAKLVILVQLQMTTGFRESWLHYQLLEWADIELGLSIFATAAAALRPLYRFVTGQTLPYITDTDDKSATVVASNGSGRGNGSGERSNSDAAQVSGTTETSQEQHAADDEMAGCSAGVSEHYELKPFNPREPTLKIEDEELGRQSSTKETRSTASV